MKKSWLAVWSIGMAVLISGGMFSCGGGDGGGDTGANNNALLSGTYFVNKIENEYGGFSTSRIDISVDGKGGGTFLVGADSDGTYGTSGTLVYTVAPDRTVTITISLGGTPVGTYSGIVSADGNMVILLDTAGGNDEEVSLAIAQKKSVVSDTCTLSGEYVFSRIGDDRSAGRETFSTLMHVAFDGSGAGTSSNVFDSRGVVLGPSFNYIVMSTGGQSSLMFTDTDNDYFGILSPDCNKFIVSDTALPLTPDAPVTTDISLGIGIKKSSAMSMDMFAGEYLINQIGWKGGSAYTSQIMIVSNSNGTGSWSIVKHSAGVSASGTFSYTVDTDGVLRVTTKDQSNVVLGTDTGIVSSDGRLFVLSDTYFSDADGELLFSMGIRK